MSHLGCTPLYMGPSSPPPGLGLAWIPVAVIEPLQGSSKRLLEALWDAGDAVLVFTSPRTPWILLEDAARHGIVNVLLDAVRRARVAVVGGRTAESVRDSLGVEPWLLPGEESTRGLQQLLSTIDNEAKIIAVRASNAPPLHLGRDYTVVHAYRIHYSRENSRLAAEALNRGLAGPGLFTSPGIAASVAPLLEPNVTVLAIGEPTARVLREHGFRPLVPPRPRISLMAEAAREACRRGGQHRR